MGYPFEVVRSPAAMRALAEDQRRDGRRLCVVPTMGYLHEGHVSLLCAGRSRADFLVMTLFVNPTQFGPGEDLDRYPRDEAGDVDKARAAGVDVVFAPDAAAMYGPGHQTSVEVPELAAPLCGRTRPGHFRGVASVVTKLFHLTLPHVAVFGQKDYQQLVIIRRMVRDLDFGIEVVGMPIAREPDGLAMSSRNAYLGREERAQATSLSRGLRAAEALFASGERAAGALVAAARAPIEAAPLARIDYAELRDADTLADIDRVRAPAVLALAVFFGRTRLIDNTLLLRAG
jgi:pantoate--beta-alanine ligase